LAGELAWVIWIGPALSASVRSITGLLQAPAMMRHTPPLWWQLPAIASSSACRVASRSCSVVKRPSSTYRAVLLPVASLAV
jgi:hypothetical protein